MHGRSRNLIYKQIPESESADFIPFLEISIQGPAQKLFIRFEQRFNYTYPSSGLLSLYAQ